MPRGVTRCRPLLNFLVKSPRYAHRIRWSVQRNRHCCASAQHTTEVNLRGWDDRCQMSCWCRKIGQIYSFLFLNFPGQTRHRRCWPKEDCDIQRQCTLKWTSKKINDFRSSLRYWPWGIVVGVSQSGSYPTKAVALLLGESRAYGLSKVLGLYCFKTVTTNDHEAHKRKEHLFIRWRTYQTVQLLVMSGNQQKQVISCKNSITQMESVWCGIKAKIP